MKALLIVAIILGLAVLWLFSGGEAKPIKHRNLTKPRLSALVSEFLLQGVDGSTLTVQEDDSGRFFQLRWETSTGRTRLRSDYPYTSWSEPYYDGFKRVLDSLKIGVVEQSGGSELATSGTVHKTLIADFGTDTAAVVEAIQSLFEQVYRIDLTTGAELYMTRLWPIRRKARSAPAT